MAEPLVPFARYQDWIGAATLEEEKRQDVLKVLVASLPPSHYVVAYHILRHLGNVRFVFVTAKMFKQGQILIICR
jgi:hypothetical protein